MNWVKFFNYNSSPDKKASKAVFLNRWAVELLLLGRQTVIILFKIVFEYTYIS